MTLSKLIFAVLALMVSSFVSALSLNWEIGNRYRSFDYLQGAQDSAKLFDEYAPRADEVDLSQWIARLVNDHKDLSMISPYSGKAGPWDEFRNHPNYQKDFVKLPQALVIKLYLTPLQGESMPTGECEVRYADNVLKNDCSKTAIIENFPSMGGLVKVFHDGQELAATEIIPTLKIVLGLGDSYAAGEGAPDMATKWSSNIVATNWPIKDPQKINEWDKAGAEWWSNRCNRSFFSAQSMAALKMARDNPHVVISFVHYACAGAEVVDGLLAPQRKAPGKKVGSCKSGEVVNPKCDVPVSQLRAALELLCKVDLEESKPTIKKIRSKLSTIASKHAQIYWINDLRACPVGQLQKPDVVLVGVGGNDIGFAGVIAWALVPIASKHSGFILKQVVSSIAVGLSRNLSGVVCPKDGLLCGKELSADRRLQDLPARYDALNVALTELLDVSGSQVVLSNYPNPLIDENGSVCNANQPGENKENEWYATRILIPSLLSPEKWEINLTQWESEQIIKWVIKPLNNTISLQGEKFGWGIPNVSGVMNLHGWCTGSNHALIPPNHLTEWNGFQDHVRMIRTSDDAVMTQWPDSNREDGIMGTFHPNVWGYASMANEIAKVAQDSFSK